MDFKEITYEKSFGAISQIPPSDLPEISFAGRSNVGKSSLLNRLFNRKNLARVSSKPGKTTTINFFRSKDLRFVDLPGYGFAHVSYQEKERWAELIEGYFTSNRNIALVVSLIDIRHAASKLDEQMIAFLQDLDLPFVIALTKADKLSRQQQIKQIKALRDQLKVASDVDFVATSAEKGTGIDDLKRVIAQHMKDE
ncbi:MAG: ribosome biogenesis GTP-binding protein YihA/YsxC [Eggerthellaceae bacterium]|jgi:GTP-binding protein